ncbi:MAG TPA: hypothetical protein VN228_00050 [Pyrinomonadaceae bacterium]|nr:hypothetical protein [Pyrinomonadaceae bacterium]
MRAYGRTCLALVALGAVASGAAVAAFSVPAQDNSPRAVRQKFDRAEFESQFPVADFDKPEPVDPERRARWRAKGKKYAGIGIRITDGDEVVTVQNEWDIGLSALPVAESDLVVLGEVTEARAYITGDKTWVYSEFVVKVGEVLKNTGNVVLTPGDSLVAGRDGGRVRFPSGRTVLQLVSGQGMPRAGRRYALFLTHADREQAAHIVTAYELRGGRVFHVDKPAGRHPLATVYNGADEISFLNDLRAASGVAR